MSYIYFWLGHIAGKLDWLDRGWATGPLYQWAMNKSSAAQDRSGCGPWIDF